MWILVMLSIHRMGKTEDAISQEDTTPRTIFNLNIV